MDLPQCYGTIFFYSMQYNILYYMRYFTNVFSMEVEQTITVHTKAAFLPHFWPLAQCRLLLLCYFHSLYSINIWSDWSRVFTMCTSLGRLHIHELPLTLMCLSENFVRHFLIIDTTGICGVWELSLDSAHNFLTCSLFSQQHACHGKVGKKNPVNLSFCTFQLSSSTGPLK